MAGWWRLRLVLLTALTILAAGCSGGSEPEAPELTAHRTGSFTVDPACCRRLTVHYAVGDGNPSQAQIVVVVHGVGRNASQYRDAWVPLIADRQAIVLAPEFDEHAYPGVEAFNLGGMVDADERDVSPDRWTFAAIEPVVAELVRRVNGSQTEFDMFGHSAGAQFVHRYVEYMPRTSMRHAVAANAGWYTMPDPAQEFPYGYRDGPAQAPDAEVFGRRLTVLLGADDVEAENLRTAAPAMAQGANRLERGLAFYRAAREAATRDDAELRWDLRVIPGIAHDHVAMSRAAAQILFGDESRPQPTR